eukprot:2614984-Rhodomonas_salina.1
MDGSGAQASHQRAGSLDGFTFNSANVLSMERSEGARVVRQHSHDSRHQQRKEPFGHFDGDRATGKDNIVPDALSRYALAPRTESWSLIQDTWGAIVKRYGPFDLDAFSDVNGVNSRARAFCSVINPPFDRQFDGLRVWAFPPPSLAAQFLREAGGWRARVLVALVPAADFRAQTGSTWQALRFFESDSR